MLYLTSSFLQGLQKPVFTAKGQVVNEKQRVMATVKENLHNASQQQHIPAATGKRKASTLNMSREINASKLSLAGKQILKGVRTNRRFGKLNIMAIQQKGTNVKHVRFSTFRIADATP